MSILAEIQAALPKLSAQDLERVESVLQRLRRGRENDARFDGRPWPTTPQQIAPELAEVDALPPLLSPEDAERFDTCLATEKERQKALPQSSGAEIGKLSA